MPSRERRAVRKPPAKGSGRSVERDGEERRHGLTPNSSTFFNLLRAHAIQGTFCDPYYGGNANFVGWDLIRYPGVRISVAAQEQRMGVALKPNHSRRTTTRCSRSVEADMATNLKKTDVVVVGLGAVGGVAVLPLARAGSR